MSVVKRYNPLKDLDELDVLIDDLNQSTHIVISDMPESLPQGKSSFLIETGPYMKEGIDLLIDFVDSEGNSIYTEPVADYLEGTSRRISVEVYSDTAPGPANIIIVGELDEVPTGPGLFSDTEPVPAEFQGAYNVRLTREVIINPVAINTQPIRFYTQPKISVTERRLGTMVRTDSTASISSSTFTVEGIPQDGFSFNPFSTEEPKQGALAETSTKIVQSKNKTGKFNRMKKSFKNKKGKRRFSIFKRAGHIAKRSSPEEFPYSYRIPGTDHNFTTKQIDGDIILKSIDTTKYNEEQFQELKLTFPPTLSSVNTSSIEDIGNSKTAFVTKPYTQTNADGEEIVLPFFGTAQTVFMPEITASYSLTNIMSYAEVKLSQMRTFSGDVFKAKVYVRPEGSFDDFKVLSEVPVESSELLIDTNSVGRGERSGYFENQSDINTYWQKFGSTNGLSVSSTEVMNFDNDTVLDAVNLSGSLSTFENQLRFELKDAYKFNLTAGLDYTLSFVAYGKKGTSNRALLVPYISGSSMYQQPVPLVDEHTENPITETAAYGKRLGELEIKDVDDSEVDFKLVTHEFTADVTGDGILQFRVIDGNWFISDISITPSVDTGFSPSFFEFDKEMPAEYQHKRPETFEFMVEFYDPNNNIADSIAFNSGSLFTGANMVITGDDNNMSGDLFIGGDTTASGMHFGGVSSTLPETGASGAKGSGFMRSVGYLGFKSASNASLGGTYGFMIYSGSVLPDSGDNYAGVGLELIGQSGSLKFRTNPSVFDVQADSFFVGKTTTQFISGSGGAIEISSSGMHITPEGDVTASAILLGDKSGGQYLQFDAGQLTVQGNLSVDNIQTPATIGGSPSTLANASASINSTGFAKFVSASIAGFTVNDVAIHSSNKSLVMSASGQITGSNVKFTGGKIAAFELSDDAFTAGNTFFISSSVTDTSGYFISSSKFNVRAGGDVTGSNVNFVGGTIGGWALGDSTITGGNLVLNKAGTVKSSDYQSDIAGFIISAEENGYAEFENIRVRGTMATTTFEKESVNAVGGQLFVANSTTLSGSLTASKTDTTMSVANASGFESGEILIAKKVTDTGFTTEYMQVDSASLDGDSGAGDVYGRIYVTRSIASSFGAGTDSGSVGDTGGASTSYHPGQVFASTGKIGTGYIRLNANPNNQATPYIDIVERTGSKPYDVELKTRVGDLSGVAGTRNVPADFTGFGLMSEVAFLSGSQIKLEAPTFLLGDLNQNFVSGSNNNIEISSSAFHLDTKNKVMEISGSITASRALIGTSTGNRVQFDGTNLVMSASTFYLGGANQFVSGAAGNIEISSSKFHIAPDGDITVRKIDAVEGSVGGFNIADRKLQSSTANFIVSGSSGQIVMGAGLGLDANRIIKLDARSETDGGRDGNAAVRVSVGNVVSHEAPFQINTAGAISASSAKISGSSIQITTPNFGVALNGDVNATDLELSGDITFTSGSTRIAQMGEITLQGAKMGGLELGNTNAVSASGGIVLRGQTTYNQMIIEGASNRFGADGTDMQIAMGLDYISDDQGIIRYGHMPQGRQRGLELINYHDSSGAPDAHTIGNSYEFIRLNPALSGSVTICEGLDGGAAENSDGSAAPFIGLHTGRGGGAVTLHNSLDYNTVIESNVWVGSVSGPLRQVQVNGDLSTMQDLSVTKTGSMAYLQVGNDIIHSGDTDTLIRFNTNHISVTASDGFHYAGAPVGPRSSNFVFARDASLESAAGTAETATYLVGPDSVTFDSNKGIIMTRAGSVTGIGWIFDIVSQTTAGASGADTSVKPKVYINGSSVAVSTTTTTDDTNNHSGATTWDYGTYTFSAGDRLNGVVTMQNGGGSTNSSATIKDICFNVEVTFDP